MSAELVKHKHLHKAAFTIILLHRRLGLLGQACHMQGLPGSLLASVLLLY